MPGPALSPHPTKAVADYVHAKDPEARHLHQCGHKDLQQQEIPHAGNSPRPGHEYYDTRQFADRGTHHLNYDDCNNQDVDAKQRYSTTHGA